MTTDLFGCELKKGDWVVYTAYRESAGQTGLRYGQIESFLNLNLLDPKERPDWFINIVGEEGLVNNTNCLLFSQEERIMRKLES